MPIKIYNTLSRSKETFKPGAPPLVTFYVCGPTVYDFIHIGNARCFIIFDVIRRYLEYRGFTVTMVQNYTDVDDKMINRANELGISIGDLAEKFIRAYEEDILALRVRPSDYQPRATEHVTDIIELIQRLLNNEYAYISNGDVYYDTNRFSEYGRLSQQKQEDLLAGARVEPGEKKRNPLDFVLWKQKKEGEPSWQSPWGEGRPGWHIECSAMSTRYIDDTLDIHAGGADLIFPHHENEIAQTWGADGRLLARYWMHAGYLNIDDQKMSKSIGNVRTVRHLLDEFDPLDLRFLILSAHYRSPLNFNADLVNQGRAGRQRIQEMLDNTLKALETAADSSTEHEKQLQEALVETRTKFVEKMDNDFNTADALGVIFDLTRICNIYLKAAHPYNHDLLSQVIQFYKDINSIFDLFSIDSPEIVDQDIVDLIARRDRARTDRDWKTADNLRNQLLEMGIILEDTPHGTRWKKKV